MKRKVAVSVPAELVEAPEAAVAAGQAPSVSAYFSDALREKTQRDSLVDVLDAMDRELGRPGKRAEAWARDVLRRPSSMPGR